MFNRKHIFLLALLTLSLNLCAQENINIHPSPLMYGLDTAKTGEGRYQALYRAHVAAQQRHTDVDYSGVGDLNIAIPKDAKTIPLTAHNDFKGITITVTNNVHDFTLFDLTGEATEIDVPQNILDSGDFTTIPQLATGRKMLLVQDKKPWTKRAGKGFDYYCYRQDIIYLVDGKATNKAVCPYGDTVTTQPKCWVAEGNDPATPLSIHDVTIRRADGNQFKAYCIRVSNCDNVELNNITIVTPRDKKKIADGAISLNNCANIKMHNVLIDGTYSQEHEYGYGIAMNNVLQSSFVKVVSRHCGWGVFGTNNIADVTLDSCDVNRFDIHCYGRDVTLRHTLFSNVRVPFGSVYGNILYDSCTFYHSVPLYIRPRYNAHVPFDVTMRNCTFYTSVTRQRNKIFDMGYLNPDTNPRPELSQKCWPNIRIENMTVYMGFGVRNLYLFLIERGKHDEKPISHCQNIIIDGFHIIGGHQTLRLCNRDDVLLKGPLKLDFKNMGTTKVVNNLKVATEKHSTPEDIVQPIH